MKVEEEGISLRGTVLDPLIEKKEIKLREIILNQTISQIKACNEINNSKYSIFTFLPFVLFYQFQHFFNLYFLGLTITQFIPALKVGFIINYVGPLSIVVCLSMCKEAYDDILRHSRDRQINNQLYQILTIEGLMNKKSGNLQVGQIVQVNKDERIPADLLILRTDDKDGNAFIRTDQLDGETDWKLRKSVKLTQNMDDNLLTSVSGLIQFEEPHQNINSFKGLVQINEMDGKQLRESTSLENVVWANSVLAVGQIYGIVIYNGNEAKMMMNQKRAQTKKGIFDVEVDKLSKLSFFIMIVLAVIITLFSSPPRDFKYVLQMYMRYLILVSNIIPISMRVNLEFAKIVYSIRINRDTKIEGTITRNSNIPESLGRISYLLSDKTGTLTQNEMIFKRFSLENEKYTIEQEDMSKIKQILYDQFKNPNKKSGKMRDFFTCLSVCHHVTPVDDEYGNRTYQAQSPDEIALIKFAAQQGFYISSRDDKEIIIHIEQKELKIMERYQILNSFPFSSENKRMGIILKNNQNQIHFYVKGADVVLKQLLPEQYQSYIDEETENLARVGLRTLVLAHKKLTQKEYEEWNEEYIKAAQLIENREQKMQKLIEQLEKQLDFIGITGVEDKLQDDVSHTIENLKNAGINVWMLTGDKMETAICIAILSGLKHATQNFIIMKDVIDEIQMSLILQNLEANSNNVLVIDGTSLQEALHGFEQQFMKAAMNCPSVICCRCSPTQKAIVTELLKKYSGLVVAAVGDGGNDVGMIQSSDVGIGVEGKEGKQAALASDFSILKFNSLNLLLLWHGRLSYKRSSLLSQFILHRGLLIATVQTIFMFLFYFLSISLFSGFLMFGYSTIFTMFPVFCIIYDEDVKQEIALRFPPLYKSIQQGRLLNTKTFLIWIWKAVFQGFIIMICSILLIKQAFLRLETTVFTCLIFTQYAMTLTELESLHIYMILSNLLSVLIYLMTLLLFPEQLLVQDTIDVPFFGWVILILLMSWVPLYILRRILKSVDPSDYEKLMDQVQRETINTN
ncbi:unnamed protein product (macronuclear) [Paramecium tetraurelia]|uniref:Phospholipid-transporting ATPase n=1 Tax=Paramecium tetraurelia TaxID=5888 RepID=A0DJM6_PARTE|nr:uncharacterized protein GSPATT00017587001 [Paramecium tetraurelia]CAK83243.1 unnamed protein product [Paramecium tetraurelia]|eukprot:XP_001450640.1 hypothetical protein (macronuclear) [Paramecium tetraurelia strain d4-2]